MKKAFLLIAMFVVAITANAQIPQTGNGDGIKGEYWKYSSDFGNDIPDKFKGTDWHTSPAQDQPGEFAFERVDSVIYFEWGDGNPFGEDGDMSFSIKWEGWLLAPVSGEYTFDMTYCDDAFALYIYDVDDMETPIAEYDNEYIGGPNFGWNWDKDYWVIPAELEEGHYYYIVLKYYENVYGAHIWFRWFHDEYSLESETVPQAQLYSSDPTQTDIKSINSESLNVRSTDGGIAILGGEEASVYTASGAKVAQVTGQGRKTVNVPAGLYIVKSGSQTKKVVVK